MSDSLTDAHSSAMASEAARARLAAVRAEVAKAVVGQDAAVSGLLVGLLCGGHVLMEGVPGVAKTLLVRSLAAALSVRTSRVQFTPDLMPGDITGSMVIDGARGELSLPRGPGLHQPAPRRRDQPHPAEDPVRAARGDGGGAGLGRRRDPRRCPGRSWSPRRRTRSSTKAPTRCPRPSSTASCSRSCCPCPSGPRSSRSCAVTPRVSTRTTWPPRAWPPSPVPRDIEAGRDAPYARCSCRPRSPATSSTSPAPRARHRRSASAPALAARSR